MRTREFKTLGSSPVLEEEEIRKYDVVIELLASTGLIGKIVTRFFKSVRPGGSLKHWP